MRYILFLVCITLLQVISPAQYFKNFDRVYGSTGVDRPVKVFYENSKTFVFGTVHKASNTVGNITDLYGQSDMNVVIYNNNGSVFKQMTYGGNRVDSLIAVFQKDSTFVMVGWSKSDNGTGNKDADNSVLTNETLSPLNINPYGGYSEIYMVAIDTKGNEVRQMSIPVTAGMYSNAQPYSVDQIAAAALANSATTYHSYFSGPGGLTYDYYEYRNLIKILGVALDGNFIKIVTAENSRIQQDTFMYYVTAPHNTSWNCSNNYVLTKGFPRYGIGAQLTEYSVRLDLSAYNIDSEKFTDYKLYTSNSHVSASCPNGCSAFPTHAGAHDYYVQVAVNYNPESFLKDWYINPGDGNFYYIYENLPDYYGAWFVNGKWIFGTERPWTYDPDGTGSYERAFSGKTHYMIGNTTFSSPNNICIKPVDIFYNNGKFYVTVMDQTTLSTVFNTSTPAPSGYSAYLHAGYVRNFAQAPTTTVPNQIDWWIAELNGVPNPNPLYATIEPFVFSTPTRQGSIRMNGWTVLTARSPVFDTSKVMYSFGSMANIQYDKHTANKGGFDYWPVKFDTKIMKCTWDTTIGGPGQDFAVDLDVKDGILVLTGMSDSPIGVDKTQPPFNNGDYWTINYCMAPVANFVANQNIIMVGDRVNFQNTSIRGSSYAWTFSDGTGTYTDKNPVHYFNNPGTYSVTLTADNGICSNTKTRPNYIIVSGYVGVDELTGEPVKVIYPNPSNGSFTLDKRATLIRVTDVLGKEVRFINNDRNVQVDGLAGVYIVYYQVEGKNYSEKLIIQK